MNTLVMVQIPQTNWYWRDLQSGYVILGEITVDESRSFEHALLADPDIAYVDLRSGRIHRYRPAQGTEPGHFEYDVDGIIDLLGYPAIQDAITKHGCAKIRFDLPQDQTLRSMTERFLEAATGRAMSELVNGLDQGLTLGSRAIKDLMIALARVGRGKQGDIQVHDLIPGLSLAA